LRFLLYVTLAGPPSFRMAFLSPFAPPSVNSPWPSLLPCCLAVYFLPLCFWPFRVIMQKGYISTHPFLLVFSPPSTSYFFLFPRFSVSVNLFPSGFPPSRLVLPCDSQSVRLSPLALLSFPPPPPHPPTPPPPPPPPPCEIVFQHFLPFPSVFFFSLLHSGILTLPGFFFKSSEC